MLHRATLTKALNKSNQPNHQPKQRTVPIIRYSFYGRYYTKSSRRYRANFAAHANHAVAVAMPLASYSRMTALIFMRVCMCLSPLFVVPEEWAACENAVLPLCLMEICRHYTKYLPPNKHTFGGKLKRFGGKTAAYTCGATSLHRQGFLLTSIANEAYTVGNLLTHYL